MNIKEQMERYWAMSEEEMDEMTDEEYERYIDIAHQYDEWYQQEGWAEEYGICI